MNTYKVPIVKPADSPPVGTHPGDAAYEQWFHAMLEWNALHSIIAQPEASN